MSQTSAAHRAHESSVLSAPLPTTTPTSPASVGGPSARLAASLRNAAILAGHLDAELGIQRAQPAASEAVIGGSQSRAYGAADLSDVLSQRLNHLGRPTSVASASSASNDSGSNQAQRASGDAALDLLADIHASLKDKKQDTTTRVPTVSPVQRSTGSSKSPIPSAAAGEEDVGLGVRDRKLATTLLSLAAKWALVPRVGEYDRALADAFPSLVPRKRSDGAGTDGVIHLSSRFEEVVEDDQQTKQAKLRRFLECRKQLIDVTTTWTSMLMSSGPTRSSLDASTDVSNLLLQTNTVELVAALLRIAMGPGASRADPAQQVAAERLTSLLKFLSTASAISTLSSVQSANPSLAPVGLPVFVRASVSRLLSAQLLRPDGVRAVLFATLGGVDAEDDVSASEVGAKSSLEKFEHLARLLGTAPQGLDASSYLALILPRLFDIIDPDPETTATAPSPTHMRAAAFALTRISERHQADFRKAVEARVYAVFEPKPSNAVAEDETVVSASAVTRALTVLWSLLLFAEPSPIFFDRLLGPVIPQLLSLHCFLKRASGQSAKSKVRQVGDVDQLAVLGKQVEGLLRAWIRLVDAADGGPTMANAIRRAQTGIGAESGQSAASDAEPEAKVLQWSQEADGVAILYGQPTQQPQDISSLFGALSFSELAQSISSSSNGVQGGKDLPSLPADLVSTLRLSPDPRVVVDLLQQGKRKDLAKSLLPHLLNAYMGQKLGRKAGIGGAAPSAIEARSILYLQLILQLFEAFGSELLEGDVGTTLDFINFSLSSPSQRRLEKDELTDVGATLASDDASGKDEMPFITAKKPSSSAAGSLFNIGADKDDQLASNLSDPAVERRDLNDEDNDGDAEEDEELVTTALSLLLSLLEGNPTLSSETTPMLLVILSKLERHLDSESTEIRALCKEARLVLTARRNASAPPSTQTATSPLSAQAQGYAKSQDTYQEALRLLQDPILPARAHGLVLLRQLVSSDPRDGGGEMHKHLDPALLPAILDIFIQAIQDEESYLYLNAVQGLSALAVSGGRGPISSLVSVYLSGDLSGGGSEGGGLYAARGSSGGSGGRAKTISAREVDKRLRVGEALLQVVQKCGDALSAHIDVLVPPLLNRLRDRATPTTLKSSIISVLGTSIEAAPLALTTGGYSREMAQTCLDIVAVETVVRADPRREKVKVSIGGKQQHFSDDDDDEEEDEEERKMKIARNDDEEATTTNGKLSSLRRAALLLLSTLLRGGKHQLLALLDRPARNEEGKLNSLRLPSGSALPSLSPSSTGPSKAAGSASNTTTTTDELLFPPELLSRTKTVVAFSRGRDDDAIVRVQASEAVEEAEEVERLLVLASSSLVRTRR